KPHSHDGSTATGEEHRHSGAILVVEDDPEVREALELLLDNEGYRAVTAPDGPAALEMVARGAIRPDIVLADYNLPGGLNGLQLAAKVRENLDSETPVIVLTGDISTATLRNIALQNCMQLNKPVTVKELTQASQRLRPRSQAAASSPAPRPAATAGGPEQPIIFVVDDDRGVRDAMQSMLEEDGRAIEAFPTAEAFLDAYHPGRDACLLIDAGLPGM